MTHRFALPCAARTAVALALLAGAANAQDLKFVPTDDVDGLILRAVTATAVLAEVDNAQASALRAAIDAATEGDTLPTRQAFLIQQTLDAACLFEVAINPESRVKVSPGPVARELTSGDWRCCLVKVHNQAGVTGPLRVSTEQERSAGQSGDRDAWLRIELHGGELLDPELTGKLVEYRVVRLHTDEVGYRSAVIAMDVGQGTADIGFRNDTLMTFRCKTP